MTHPHRMIVWLWVLVAAQQFVDESGNVTDAYIPVEIDVSCLIDDGTSAEQQVDEYRHVAYGDGAVSVQIARNWSRSIGKVSGIVRATVDMGIGLVNIAGVIDCALTAHEAGAALEHDIGVIVISDTRGGPASAHLDGD